MESSITCLYIYWLNVKVAESLDLENSDLIAKIDF